MQSRDSGQMVEEAFAAVPDWSREAKRSFSWDPSRALIASIRSYQRHAARRGPIASLGRKLAVLRHRFWSVITGADIPINTTIAGGLVLPHPNGIVIHPSAVIGPNCLLFHQVTLGMGRDGVPTLGAGVDIGAGAKLIGRIMVGDRAIVGANAVVLSDVPAGATVVGIPARIVAPS